jgi:Tol biopolymer transport system component/predicted Ser/Thr protein kinase
VIGQTISHYKITEKLGEGGMGVVYKAEDTNLKRPVALKFLAAHLLGDGEIKARFRREAEAAAALNHPNICHVYEISEVEGKTFIAMAFLEGEGLDKKIEAGPLKLKDALDVAIQTAHGLQAAHEKKIVHRDIKPANLMVTDSGSKRLVTIMDFGLAQLADRSKLTRLDETMGTVTYMSPEQTYGMDLDHRTDVWSLGVVIYEMVTGQQPFKGHYDKAVMYSITNEEYEPITALRAGVPMELELLVNKALAKEADRRYQSTADMVVDLESLSDKLKSGKSAILKTQAGSQMVVTQPPMVDPSSSDDPLAKYRVIENLEEQDDSVVYRAEDSQLHRSVAIRIVPESAAQKLERRAKLVQGALIAVTLLSLLTATFLLLRDPDAQSSRAVDRFSLTVPDVVGAAVSPDGRRIAYVVGEDLEGAVWIRDLDRERPRKLEGTEDAERVFWSPDSQFIGFATNHELKRIAADGGNPITLCQLPDSRSGTSFIGGSWSPQGDRIVFSSGLEMFELPAGGGAPKLIEGLEYLKGNDDRLAFVEPNFLPRSGGSQALVYSFGASAGEARLGVLDFETGERRELGLGAEPTYSASGHLVYQTSGRDSGLWALPFSLDTLTSTGEAFRIAEAGEDPTVGRDGTLVYFDLVGDREDILVWRDRTDKRLGTIGQPQQGMRHPALSPDGDQVAVSARDEDGNRDIWVHDVAGGRRARLTLDSASNDHATWSPSGKEVTFRAGFDIQSKTTDGSSEAVTLAGGEIRELAPDWSRDGKFLIYWTRTEEGLGDLSYIQRQSDGSFSEPTVYLNTDADERGPKFSPDGRYVVYCSLESGRWEVYARRFPDGSGRKLISVNGGQQPRWRRDGKELFYVEGSSLMAVSVSTEGELEVGRPEKLFDTPELRDDRGPAPRYDVAAHGRKFVMVAPFDEGTDEPTIRVVQNWYEEFRERAQNQP